MGQNHSEQFQAIKSQIIWFCFDPATLWSPGGPAYPKTKKAVC